MAEEHRHTTYEQEGSDEIKGRGMFDFLGKKEEEKPQEEVIVTEFEKVQVSEEPCEKKEEVKEGKPGPEKLHRSTSSYSSLLLLILIAALQFQPTVAREIHEIELGSIQPLTQQHASHDAHQSLPVTDERTSDVTGHLSLSDDIVITIHGYERDAIQPLTQWQTSPDAYQRMSTNGTDQMVPSNPTLLTNINNRQQQNPLHGFLSRVVPSTDRIFDDEPNYIALFFYAHVIIVALPFLFGLSHLILPIG